ncbi:MBL fold metallo-hydrolase [Nocardioides sp. CFH 31398]|uniref:MBL fold metallo-hydrolase n=1 Tax=Nocardioides sp. CFH 31398 TaxID=2919579 RepID=UPI001F0602E7|nr:MBL fold metallo-hydrolase [Nocardioides sp. CFH 31398]MCH1868436.1 MBL fold metallo-hydrolase [Nocardioides sp. CFH 31398]
MGQKPSFVEVADRVWVRRHRWYDVSVSVVGGDRGLVVVDTHASGRAMGEVLDDLASLRPGDDVVAVVNTHAHVDHVLGNRAVRERRPGVPVHAHEDAAAAMPSHLAELRTDLEGSPDTEQDGDPHRDELLASLGDPVLPDHTLSSVAVVDLGDRALELVHPGRGHTAGDLVVRVPDADVVLAGDLVESSDRDRATPGLGPDSFPLEWPLTLDFVLQLVTPATVVVPGHGPTVDRAFVQEQRADLGILAETVRDLAGRGVRVEDALGAAPEWPFPAEHLGDAVRRIYAHLPRAQKRLPLV